MGWDRCVFSGDFFIFFKLKVKDKIDIKYF
jgi:hypothetical protein